MSADITAQWDGEDWNFAGEAVRQRWGMSSVCFSPTELGYAYSKAARLTPAEAIEAFVKYLKGESK